MKINDLIKEAHETAISKGWHDEERSFGDLIALIHSELSEALEEFRNGHKPDEINFQCKNCLIDGCDNTCKSVKPEGIPIELADALIRIFDMCGKYGIDLEKALKIKMQYNKSRPHRHGGKVL